MLQAADKRIIICDLLLQKNYFGHGVGENRLISLSKVSKLCNLLTNNSGAQSVAQRTTTIALNEGVNQQSLMLSIKCFSLLIFFDTTVDTTLYIPRTGFYFIVTRNLISNKR